MTSSTLSRRALLPHPPDRLGASLGLALFAHALLIVALAFGVSWRASEPAGVEAELWAAVPQIAAPRAVAPEPAPVEVKRAQPPPVQVEPPAVKLPDPQIAIEQEKARREEARREEARREEAKRDLAKHEEELRQKELQRKHKEQADKERREAEAKERREEAELAAAREKNIERILGQAGGTADSRSTGSAAQSAGPSAGYAGRIKARIKPNIVFADSLDGNPLATVEVRLAPDGTITSKRLVKSSGVRAWDDAVLRAVEKTEVLPRDVDGRVPPTIEIDFRPRD